MGICICKKNKVKQCEAKFAASGKVCKNSKNLIANLI